MRARVLNLRLSTLCRANRLPLAAVFLALVVLVSACGANKPAATPTARVQPAATSTVSARTATPAATQPASSQPKQWSSPPAMQIDTAKSYAAVFETDMGNFRVDLFTKDAPRTVNNFVFLARQGFYDGTKFHRIIKNFMIQGGDPLGTGMGGPGYRFPDELPTKRPYDPGIVAMANAGPDTQGSQFFICNGTDCRAFLDRNPNYTQFGQVVEGMDVVLKISSVEVVPQGNETSRPRVPPVIKKIAIEER